MRKLIEYDKSEYGLRSKALKLGVAKSEGPPKKLKYFITGTGRCGTTFMAKIMQKLGYDVPHEKTGEDGVSSLYFLVDSEWYPMWPWYRGRVHVGERRSDFEFEKSVQMVRHPLKTIPSMMAIFPGLNYEFFEVNDIIPKGLKSRLHKCMYAYRELNRMAEEQCEVRARIEWIAADWSKLSRYLFEDPNVPLPVMKPANRATGFRTPQPMTWEDLNTVDELLTRELKKQSRRYGYE